MQQTFKTYEVDRIVKMRVRQGKIEYLLKYYRYPQSCNTWEPAENISCDELLNEFEKELEVKMKHIKIKAEKKWPIRQVLQRTSAKKARNWISKLLMPSRKCALVKTESRDKASALVKIKEEPLLTEIISEDCPKIPLRTSAKGTKELNKKQLMSSRKVGSRGKIDHKLPKKSSTQSIKKVSCSERNREVPLRISTMKGRETISRKLTALVEPLVDPNIAIKREPMPLEHICINIPSHPFSLYGFARGLEPERIVGASKESGTLILLIKWKNLEDVDIVSASEANLKCPQIVIKYYQSIVEI